MYRWRWLGYMKQADGGFTVCDGGEEDIRGAYCAMTIISLLNIPLDLPADAPARAAGHTTLISGLGEWISSTQTYEGGIASRPSHEAHGGYAFCALAALSILGPPRETIPKYLNIHSLIRWISARQYAPEGGLSGRTNKLVDACYSHWVGGCWALIDAALGLVETDLWSREGLARYILCAAQFPRGGLRDKPSKPVDSYHTCYSLAGLAACEGVTEWKKEGGEWVVGNELTAPFGWTVVGRKEGFCDEGEGVVPLHPVFVVPVEQATKCREYFEGKEGF
jgi:protein farnesyltransferase subunit beta